MRERSVREVRLIRVMYGGSDSHALSFALRLLGNPHTA